MKRFLVIDISQLFLSRAERPVSTVYVLCLAPVQRNLACLSVVFGRQGTCHGWGALSLLCHVPCLEFQLHILTWVVVRCLACRPRAK